METNDVGIDKIIAARYDNVINEMFVLRYDKKADIVPDVLEDYYKEITSSIESIDAKDTVTVPGRLINIEKNS